MVSVSEDEIENNTLDMLNSLKIEESVEVKNVTKDEESFNNDEEDELLCSSPLLSNSQIIKSSNVDNLKNEITLKSITNSIERDNLVENKENKNHFKLSLPKEQSYDLVDSNHSDISEDLEASDIELSNGVPVNQDEIPISRSITRSGSCRFIDIDNPASTPKLPKINSESTPWRRLRPRSEFLDNDLSSGQKLSTPIKPNSINFMKSIFDSSSTESEFNKSSTRSTSLFDPVSSSGENSSSTTATSSYELENLRKQITNYKLQQRLLSEFIRNILKESGKGEDFKTEIMQRLEKENGILLGQREALQNEMKNQKDNLPPLPIDSAEKIDNAKYSEKVKEALEFKNDLIATQNLNDELNSYLDELKAKVTDQELSLQTYLTDSERWKQLVNDILTITVDFLNPDSAKAVVQTRDESNSLDIKLKVLSFALNEILQKYDQIATSLNTLTSQPPKQESITLRSLQSEVQPNHSVISDNMKLRIQQKRAVVKQIEEDIKNLLIERADEFETVKIQYNSLLKKYTENVQFISSLKKLLTEKRTKITELNDKIVRLELQLEELSDLQQPNTKDQETELLKNRLNVIRIAHSKEVENLKFEIEELKIEVERQKASSNKEALESELKKKQKEISDLNAEVRHLKDKISLHVREIESQGHFKELIDQTQENYNVLQRDYSELEEALKETQNELESNERNYKKKLEHAAKELGLAVTKQRTLSSEKHKATFSLEEVTKEKTRLLMNNHTLSEKVAKLSYQISSLRGYEIGYKNQFQLQISTIESFLIQFENVLEPSSIKQAQRKLQKLFNEQLDFEQSYSIMRSLLAYISNATASLIEDYSMLVKDDNNDSEEVDQLREEINNLREELQWCYDNGTFESSESSPRAKLRINELEKLRKAERESRKQEHHAFVIQVKTLEQENRELKEKLKRLGK